MRKTRRISPSRRGFKVISLLKNLKGQPKEVDGIAINGYFLIEISLDNANRADEIRHITVEEMMSAIQNDDGSFTVFVQTHKTYVNYGPSDLVLNKDLAPLIKKILSLH